MKNKQKKTLAKLQKLPVPANLRYKDVVSLLNALDLNVIEDRSGSRVFVEHADGPSFGFHKPHPQKEMTRISVRRLREYLKHIGLIKGD